MLRFSVGLSLAASALGCSHFAMEDDFALTGRTMDLETIPNTTWSLITKGQAPLKRGYLGFILQQSKTQEEEDIIYAGVNDAGLSCDLNVLLGTEYPEPSKDLPNYDVMLFCHYVLSTFSTAAEAKEGLPRVNFVKPHGLWAGHGLHFALRDAQKQGVIIEWLNGAINIYQDNNDQGKTAFGIMTNEPPLLWQLEAVRHLEWKKSLARSAVSMPGTWYPDERFQRIHLVKSGMPKPSSYSQAFAQTVHVLNTVTVPMGLQMGTDSGGGSGEGSADHTQWGVIYDHKSPTLYWRSFANQNFQRLQLKDLDLRGEPKSVEVVSASLPWFSDAHAAMHPWKSSSQEISV